MNKEQRRKYYDAIVREAAACRERDASARGVELLADVLTIDATEAALEFIHTLERVVDKLWALPQVPEQSEDAVILDSSGVQDVSDEQVSTPNTQDASTGVSRRWTEAEVRILKTRLHGLTEPIARSVFRVIAEELGRTPSSVALKWGRLNSRYP